MLFFLVLFQGFFFCFICSLCFVLFFLLRSYWMVFRGMTSRVSHVHFIPACLRASWFVTMPFIYGSPRVALCQAVATLRNTVEVLLYYRTHGQNEGRIMVLNSILFCTLKLFYLQTTSEFHPNKSMQKMYRTKEMFRTHHQIQKPKDCHFKMKM